MARTSPSRVSSGKVLRELRIASRKGDRAALAVALDQMRTLAFSPRYWERYLGLLRNPLARLVDLLVIKQGERIAHQKGWKVKAGPARRPRAPTRKTPPKRKTPTKTPRRRLPTGDDRQPSLFDL